MMDSRTSKAMRDTNWKAFAIMHNSHGLSLDTLIWLPENDWPETRENWVEVPWMDKPIKCTCKCK